MIAKSTVVFRSTLLYFFLCLLRMAKKGIRLFKLASQIQVGKDRIVEHLQSKGFDIQNKATTTVDDEMLDVVMQHFQREAIAAERQEEKFEAHRKTRQAAEDKLAGEADLLSPVDGENQLPLLGGVEPEAETAAKTADAETSDAETAPAESQLSAETDPPTQEAPAGDSDVPVAEEAPPRQEDSPGSSAEEEAKDGIPVGSVITLEEPTKKGKSKSGKKSKAKTAAESPVEATPAEGEAEPQDKRAAAKKKPEPASEVIEAETSTAEEVAATIAEPEADAAIATDSPEQTPEADTTVLAEESAEIEAESAFETDSGDEQELVEAEDDAEVTAADETEEIGGKKRRRKKKIAEIEYQTGESPQLKGLTILGKIDLVPRAKKKDVAKKRIKKEKSEADPAVDPVKQEIRSKGSKQKFSNRIDLGSESESAKGKKRRKKSKKVKVSAEEVDKAIRKTLAGADDSSISMRSKMRQRRRQERAEEQERLRELEEQESTLLRVTEFITVAELANLMNQPVNELILKCMQLGLMVSINQRLDNDTITLIADDYGYEIEFDEEFSDDSIADEEDPEDTLRSRAPIVTIMGHVDHGKTSLLDHIRSANVVAGEAGGITQHIGAYNVNVHDDKSITFLDTPGHQAFTAMRARGAQVTDLVVLIAAADDNVMPQTIEAISHARAANVPIVVAINKIDRPDSNPDRIRQQLSDHDVLVEDWGGKVQTVEISAKTGQNVDQLLEKILLEAELLELKANPGRSARGTIIESKIDKGKGAIATVIIQKGTLKVGDPFICGIHSGRVRAMIDERGHRVEEAGPSTPVQVLGFDNAPQAGDQFVVTVSESEAKQLASKRAHIKREQAYKQIRHITLDDLAHDIALGGVQDLPIILKADADGSVEALTDALHKLSTEEVRVSVIHKGVGAITESDIILAAASNAIVIGFHIRPTPQAKKLAENEGVDIRIYRIIYDCINEVKLALEGLLRPEIKEEISGMVEVRDIFKISKVGTIAGSYVLEGKINRNDNIRLVRDGFEVYEGKIASLKRHKDDVREVDSGYECGIVLEGFNDIKVGDIVESVKITEIKRKLEKSAS